MGTEPPTKKVAEPPTKNNSAHVYCGQTARWMKLVLGMEVCLGPGDFVLDGDRAPSPTGGGARSPIFSPCLLRPNGRMNEAGTWHGCRPQPRRLCVRWGPTHPKKGPGAPAEPPIFRPMCIVTIRLHGSRCHLLWRQVINGRVISLQRQGIRRLLCTDKR